MRTQEAAQQVSQSAEIATIDSRQPGDGPLMADRRPAASALRQLVGIANDNPRALQLRALSEAIHQSPRMLAQRQQSAPANNSGLPERLKAGVESLTGMRMDHVKVHYNSPQPAQLNALAYAQGSDIHVASGQEKHLPHEAWHVVQQAQGRVQPTRQMQAGTPINDNPGLEREADAMGARASALGHGGAAGNASNAATTAMPPTASGTAAPRQLLVDIVAAPVIAGGTQEPSFDSIRQNGLAGTGLFVTIDWTSYATDIYAIIATARLTLEDDADLTELAAQEAQADVMVTTANTHVVTFDSTDRWGRVGIAGTLHGDVTALQHLLAEIQELYVISEGGFSAVGRARQIEGVEIGAEHHNQEGADNSFINDITLDGQALNAGIGVHKPDTDAIAGPIALRVNGATPVQTENAGQRAIRLAALEDQLDPPAQAQDAVGVDNFVGVDRNGGQQANMRGTNARGYAWVTRTAGWNTTQWEWLHIRGASLGGVTGPTNLVLGTRDSNTHMMPFESNLKSLARSARENPDYADLNVTWSIDHQVHPHSWQTIAIEWTLNRAEDADAEVREPTGRAEFSPLETGSVLSKTEVEYLEDALREARPVDDMQVEEDGDGEDEDDGAAVGEGMEDAEIHDQDGDVML